MQRISHYTIRSRIESKSRGLKWSYIFALFSDVVILSIVCYINLVHSIIANGIIRHYIVDFL